MKELNEDINEDNSLGLKDPFIQKENDMPRENVPMNKKIIKEEKKPKKNKFERNLLFNLKKVSIFALIFHISSCYENVLMLIAFISTIFSGISTPLLATLFGGSINIFKDSATISPSDPDYDTIINNLNEDLKTMIVKILVFGGVMFISFSLMQWGWVYSSLRQMDNFKQKYFSIILQQKQTFFDTHNPYEFSTKVQAQCEKIEGGIGDKFGQIILTLIQIIAGYVFGFIASWKLTLILISVLPIFIISSYVFKHYYVDNNIRAAIVYEKTGGVVEELLYNIITVTSFANFDFEIKRYVKMLDEANGYEKVKNLAFGVSVMLITFAHYFGLGSVVLFGRKFVSKGEISPGNVLMVILSVIPALYGTGRVAPNIQNVHEAALGSSDYFTLRDQALETEKHIKENNKELYPEPESIKGKITFENVSFKYSKEKGTKYVLDNISFTIQPGQKVAIVGSSGCGKSTIINLIERFYDFEEGNILIDDINIKDININHLRNLLGYVQQEPVLFNNSIKENIIFGRDELINKIYGINDKVDSKEVKNHKINNILESVCTDSYSMEFISKLENKFDFVVGIKGGKLSGGQKQRIAIARSLLLKPKIILLDEATSALDNQSEKEVQKALDSICTKNITTITIAHRLSTIKNSDIIFVLNNGKIVEKGNHDELLKLNGYYAKMIQIQLEQEMKAETKKKEEKEKEYKNRLSLEELKLKKKKSKLFINEENKEHNILNIGNKEEFNNKNDNANENNIANLNININSNINNISNELANINNNIDNNNIINNININKNDSNIQNKEDISTKTNEIKVGKEMIEGIGNSDSDSEVIVDKKNNKKDSPKTNKLSVWRLWKLITEVKYKFIIATVSTLIFGLIHPTVGLLTGLTINSFSSKDSSKIESSGLTYGLYFYGIALVGAGTSILRIWLNQAIGTYIAYRMRKIMIEKYLSMHISYFDDEKHSPGSLLTKLSIDTTQIHLVILSVSQTLFTNLGMLILGFILSFYYDWRISLINLPFIPFIILSQFLMMIYQRGGKYAYKKLQIESGNILSECVVNTKTVFSFNFQAKAVDMYCKISLSESSTHFKDSIMQGFLIGFCNFCGFACYAAIFYSCAQFMIKKTLTFDNMNCTINVLMTMTSGISLALANLADYRKAKLAFQSLFQIIDTESLINAFEEANKNKISIKNKGNKKEGLNNEALIEEECFKGKIEFRNVYFSYPTKKNSLILKNVSFTIQPGMHVALVGNSGCGKSTIIRLIERFYDVLEEEGEILIDDINIKDYNLYELRKNIGLVQQEPVLFKRSVKENIEYGKIGATDEEINEAAIKSNISKYIFNIKNEDLIDNKNSKEKNDLVSGGEKQRIAIARIFLKNPKILLLDEPTSALDKENEIEIQKNLEMLSLGRTSITVAHRMSTIINSDIIFVFHDGELVEQGTHNELMGKNGYYSKLYLTSL